MVRKKVKYNKKKILNSFGAEDHYPCHYWFQPLCLMLQFIMAQKCKANAVHLSAFKINKELSTVVKIILSYLTFPIGFYFWFLSATTNH